MSKKIQVIRLNMDREAEANLARRIAAKLGKRIKPGLNKFSSVSIHVVSPRKSEVAEHGGDDEGEEE